MGLLAGGRFFEDLDLIPAARAGDAEALRALILHSIRFKAEVVAEDEREGGRRAILNYGHTIGHALEAAAGFALPHGSAVAAGMVAEATISRARFGADLTDLHERLLESAVLPAAPPASTPRPPSSPCPATRSARPQMGWPKAGHAPLCPAQGRGLPVYGVPVGDDEARRAIGAVVGLGSTS
jgi:3-dehydroquinate synthase